MRLNIVFTLYCAQINLLIMKKFKLLFAITLSFLLFLSQKSISQTTALNQSNEIFDETTNSSQHKIGNTSDDLNTEKEEAYVMVLQDGTSNEFKVLSVNELLKNNAYDQLLTDNMLIAAKIPNLTAEELMKKGKRKTILGGVFTGVGVLGLVGGISLISDATKDAEVNSVGEVIAEGFVKTFQVVIGSTVAFLGLASTTGGILFFSRGAKLKKAARLKMSTGTLMIPQEFKAGSYGGNNGYQMQVGLSLDL